MARDGLRRQGQAVGPCRGASPLRARLDPQARGWGGDMCSLLRVPLDGEKVATQCILPYLLRDPVLPLLSGRMRPNCP